MFTQRVSGSSLLILTLSLFAPGVSAATFGVKSAPPTTLILVRHAEKAAPADMAGDPPLSAAGKARAVELARILESAGVSAIYVTPYERTRKTAAPLAARLNIVPIEVKAGKTYGDDLLEMIFKKHAGDTVLVVGHSNTTPEVIRMLGVTQPVTIAESEYDDLFVVTVAEGVLTKLLALRYGAPAH